MNSRPARPVESSESTESAESVYRRAVECLRAGRAEEGIALLEAVADAMPRALGDLAYAYRERGEHRKALECLRRHLEHFPDDAGAWGLIAQSARALNDLTNARIGAEKAAAFDSRNAERWFELGMIFFFLRDWKAASRAFRRCLRADPNFSRARVFGALSQRERMLQRIRFVTWNPPVSGLLRYLLSRRFVSEWVERGSAVRLDDARWRIPLGASPMEAAPTGQSPEEFGGHFGNCDCLFWRWFREQWGLLPKNTAQAGRLRHTSQASFSVLEVGTGAGDIAEHFARGGFSVRSATPGELARRDRERRGIAAIRSDLHFIPERGSQFDLVVAPYALQQSRAPLFALFEWKRLLRPDGCLFLMAHLAVDRPAEMPSHPVGLLHSSGDATGECGAGGPPVHFDRSRHLVHGVPGQIVTLTYWQLRWLFKHAGLRLIAEALEVPETSTLRGTEPVDGREPPDPLKAWNVFFLLQKPGALPYDNSLEKPRPIWTDTDRHGPARA